MNGATPHGSFKMWVKKLLNKLRPRKYINLAKTKQLERRGITPLF